MIKNTGFIKRLLCIAGLASLTLLRAQAHDATADASTGRITQVTGTTTRTINSNCTIYGYAGNIGSSDSVFVICFEMPNYPSDEVIDAATLSVYLNSLSGGTYGNASVYGVRTSSSAGIVESDYVGGTELVNGFLSSSLTPGYVSVVDSGPTPMVDWLAANAAPNEFVILRIQTDTPQTNYRRYNLADESQSGKEPTFSFTSSSAAEVETLLYGHSTDGYADSLGATVSSSTYAGSLSPTTTIRSAIFVFEITGLPTDSTISDASLDLHLYQNSVNDFNGDLWAVRISSSPDIVAGDYFTGAYNGSNDAAIADNLVVPSSLINQVYSTDDTADDRLAAWLDDQGAHNGDYVFLRVNADAVPGGTYDLYRFDQAGSANGPELTITTTGGDVGGSGGNSMDDIRSAPIAMWTGIDSRDVSGTARVGIAAYHANGIQKVDFSVEGGSTVSVTSETINPDTGEMEFVLAFDSTAYTEDTLIEVDAEVFSQNLDSDSYTMETISLWVNNTSSHTIYYVDQATGSDTGNDGSSSEPYATIGKAVDVAAGGDEIRVRNGNYDMGVDSGNSLDRFVHIHPDTGASPKITSTSTLRANFMHIEGFEFDLTGITPTLQDGGVTGNVFTSWAAHHFWLENCEIHGPNGIYNNFVHAVKCYGSTAHVLIEDCEIYDLDKAIILPNQTSIARGNLIHDMTADSFNFHSETLITGNTVYGISAPTVYIDSGSATFDLDGKDLDFHYKEFNSGEYVVIGLTDLGASASNPNAVTAAELVATLMADTNFSDKFVASVEGNKVRVSIIRTNHLQALYVTGTANASLGFTQDSLGNRAEGSGQHADIFQTWDSVEIPSIQNVIIRNNKAYEEEAQGLLPQTNITGMAFVNNLLDRKTSDPWNMNFQDFAYENILIAHNTIWGSGNSLILAMSAPVDFVVANNIIGPTGTIFDVLFNGLYMDYNLYDFNSTNNGGTSPAANSLDTNTSHVSPTPTSLFDNVTATYDAATGVYEYAAPNGDFSLHGSSPAIDVGTDIIGISYDIDWNPRDSSPDMGAWED